MSYLSNLSYEPNTVVQKDVLGGGFSPLSSNIYDLTIKLAFLTKSQKGAWALNIHAETDSGRKYRETIYYTNKEGSNQYSDKKTGQMEYLPGFLQLDGLCLLTVGKPFKSLDSEIEVKTIKLYNYEAKAEINTDVPMIMPLIGQKIRAGIQHVVENKKAKGDNGYVPTNEKRESNVIDKFFRERDNLTVSEILARQTEAKFYKEWLKEWEGKVNDQFKPVAGTGATGAPTGAFAGAGTTTTEPAGTTSNQDNLFM